MNTYRRSQEKTHQIYVVENIKNKIYKLNILCKIHAYPKKTENEGADHETKESKMNINRMWSYKYNDIIKVYLFSLLAFIFLYRILHLNKICYIILLNFSKIRSINILVTFLTGCSTSNNCYHKW